jgi:hypothetical protein
MDDDNLNAALERAFPTPIQIPVALPIQYPATFGDELKAVEEGNYAEYKNYLFTTFPRRVGSVIPVTLGNIATHSADLHEAGLTSAGHDALAQARLHLSSNRYAARFLNEFTPQIFSGMEATVHDVKRQAALLDSNYAVDLYIRYLKLEAQRYGTDMVQIAKRDLNDRFAHVQLRALALNYFQVVLPRYKDLDFDVYKYKGGKLAPSKLAPSKRSKRSKRTRRSSRKKRSKKLTKRT